MILMFTWRPGVFLKGKSIQNKPGIIPEFILSHNNPSPTMIADKDQPPRDDIRLLGRLLGDTVREQEGLELFEQIELIRQLVLDPVYQLK